MLVNQSNACFYKMQAQRKRRKKCPPRQSGRLLPGSGRWVSSLENPYAFSGVIKCSRFNGVIAGCLLWVVNRRLIICSQRQLSRKETLSKAIWTSRIGQLQTLTMKSGFGAYRKHNPYMHYYPLTDRDMPVPRRVITLLAWGRQARVLIDRAPRRFGRETGRWRR